MNVTVSRTAVFGVEGDDPCWTVTYRIACDDGLLIGEAVDGVAAATGTAWGTDTGCCSCCGESASFTSTFPSALAFWLPLTYNVEVK